MPALDKPANPLDALVPPRGAQRVASERGWIAYWEMGPQICLTKAHGYMTRDMGRLIIDRAGPLYERAVGQVHGFHNWLEMENYESACRVDLTNWALHHRSQSILHVGLRSRIVAMGVAVANVALGSVIKIYQTEEALAAALAETLAAQPVRAD
jgi:hypothetical protein